MKLSILALAALLSTTDAFQLPIKGSILRASPTQLYSQSADFDKTVKSKFPGAITNDDLKDTILNILEQKGLTPDNTLLCTSLCCDELARVLEDDLVDIFGNNFNLGGLSGFPFAGTTGFGAMAAHVPDDGFCLLVHGPHVGISKEGVVGKVERSGIVLVDNCCGSAIAASNYLKGITDGSAAVNANIQSFTDFQQGAVQELILPHGKRLSDADDRMKEIPFALYESQDILVREIIEMGSASIKKGLALVGGVQINTGPDTPDYFVPLRFDFYDETGKSVEDLLPSLKAGGPLPSTKSTAGLSSMRSIMESLPKNKTPSPVSRKPVSGSAATSGLSSIKSIMESLPKNKTPSVVNRGGVPVTSGDIKTTPSQKFSSLTDLLTEQAEKNNDRWLHAARAKSATFTQDQARTHSGSTPNHHHAVPSPPKESPPKDVAQPASIKEILDSLPDSRMPYQDKGGKPPSSSSADTKSYTKPFSSLTVLLREQAEKTNDRWLHIASSKSPAFSQSQTRLHSGSTPNHHHAVTSTAAEVPESEAGEEAEAKGEDLSDVEEMPEDDVPAEGDMEVDVEALLGDIDIEAEAAVEDEDIEAEAAMEEDEVEEEVEEEAAVLDLKIDETPKSYTSLSKLLKEQNKFTNTNPRKNKTSSGKEKSNLSKLLDNN